MAQTINFDRWIMYGSGWEVSFIAKVTLSVTRAYGSDTATVSGTAYIQSVGGSTNTKAKMRIQIGGTYQDVNIAGSNGSGGWYTYWAGDWYSQTFSFNVSVGATGGTLSGNVYFRANDINGPQADSSTKTYSQTYGTKGASSISSATNVQLNTSGTATSTVTFVSYSSSFTHKVKATLGSASTSEVTVSGGNSVTKTATLTFPASFINQITTAKTGTATVTLTTYSGSTSIGSSTKTITLTVPSGINPSVSNVTATKVSALSQTYFSGKLCTVIDKARITWSESTQYGSAISSRRTVFNGATSTSASGFTSGVLTTSGNNTATVTITDDRGNSGTASNTAILVYKYFYPSISSVKYKTDNSLDISGSIAYVGGSNAHTITLKIYKGSATTGTTVDLSSYIPSATGGTYDATYTVKFNYPIPASYIPDIATETYRFVVTFTDTVKSVSYTVYSAIAVMTFGAGGTNATIHKPLRMQNDGSDSGGMIQFYPQYDDGTNRMNVDAYGNNLRVWSSSLGGYVTQTKPNGYFNARNGLQVGGYTVGQWYRSNGTLTTTSWDTSTTGVQVTLPTSGLYIVWIRFALNSDTQANRGIYKQLNFRIVSGSVTYGLEASQLFWDDADSTSPAVIRTISQPILVTSSTAVIAPTVYTGTAGVVFNVAMCAIYLGKQ